MNTNTPTEQAPVVCRTCHLGTLSPIAREWTQPVLTVFLGYPCTICRSWETCPASPAGVHFLVTAAGVPEVDLYADPQPVFDDKV